MDYFFLIIIYFLMFSFFFFSMTVEMLVFQSDLLMLYVCG